MAKGRTAEEALLRRRTVAQIYTREPGSPTAAPIHASAAGKAIQSLHHPLPQFCSRNPWPPPASWGPAPSQDVLEDPAMLADIDTVEIRDVELCLAAPLRCKLLNEMLERRYCGSIEAAGSTNWTKLLTDWTSAMLCSVVFCVLTCPAFLLLLPSHVIFFLCLAHHPKQSCFVVLYKRKCQISLDVCCVSK